MTDTTANKRRELAAVAMQEAQRQGVRLSVAANGTLLCRRAAGPPPPALRKCLVEFKPEILAMLTGRAEPPPPPEPTPPDAGRSAAPWTDEELARACRAIEADLGLSAGSLALFPRPRQCPGCEWCRPGGNAP